MIGGESGMTTLESFVNTYRIHDCRVTDSHSRRNLRSPLHSKRLDVICDTTAYEYRIGRSNKGTDTSWFSKKNTKTTSPPSPNWTLLATSCFRVVRGWSGAIESAKPQCFSTLTMKKAYSRCGGSKPGGYRDQYLQAVGGSARTQYLQQSHHVRWYTTWGYIWAGRVTRYNCAL